MDLILAWYNEELEFDAPTSATNSWQHATVSWLCKADLFAPPLLPKMRGGKAKRCAICVWTFRRFWMFWMFEDQKFRGIVPSLALSQGKGVDARGIYETWHTERSGLTRFLSRQSSWWKHFAEVFELKSSLARIPRISTWRPSNSSWWPWPSVTAMLLFLPSAGIGTGHGCHYAVVTWVQDQVFRSFT